MAVAYLAIVGFPFLSGYFSKDSIIEAAFSASGWQGPVLGWATVVGAGITAFYMTRLMIMTFFGEPRWKQLKSTDGRDYHPHEASAVMTGPMIVLAIGSAAAGWFLYEGERLAAWLTPSVGEFVEPDPPMGKIPVTLITLAFVTVGIVIAYLAIGRRPVPVRAPENVNWVVRFARADAGGNAINETLVARPGTWLGRTLVFADVKGVDGAVNGVAATLGGLSGRWRRWQNGFVRSYALSMLAGTLVLTFALILVRFA
jgi:NADH-quinone oxidoreductase subunit L